MNPLRLLVIPPTGKLYSASFNGTDITEIDKFVGGFPWFNELTFGAYHLKTIVNVDNRFGDEPRNTIASTLLRQDIKGTVLVGGDEAGYLVDVPEAFSTWLVGALRNPDIAEMAL